MKRLWRSLAVLAVVALVGVSPVSAGGPWLEVASPAPGATVAPHPQLGPIVIVQLKVKDFKLTDFTKATMPKMGEGHIHIQLDDQAYNTHVSDSVWVFGGVKPGKHTLTVELVNNDHTPLKPTVKQAVTFTMGQ